SATRDSQPTTRARSSFASSCERDPFRDEEQFPTREARPFPEEELARVIVGRTMAGMSRAEVIVVSILACSSVVAAAPIAGVVFDGTTMTTIPNATIKVQGTAVTVTSDAAGGFQLDLPAGTITLDVSAAGYEIAEQDVVV